jgi:hypothetical protein
LDVVANRPDPSSQDPSAPAQARSRWSVFVPWAVSAALLFYLFGFATDWDRLREATSRANLPFFLACGVADRLAFFFVWTWLSAAALRRFVAEVPFGSVIAIRGGSELVRVVSNHLADAAFLLGVVRLVGGRLDAVLACTLVPVVSHFFVMLVQMTLALPFLRGDAGDNLDVVGVTAVMWTLVIACAIGVRLSRSRRVRSPALDRVAAWLERFPLRKLWPFLWGFGLLALFDIQIQWLATRAFGVPIDWTALAARIPLVYLAFLIPSLGNFGTREMAWASAFSDFGSRDSLIAYAFAVNAVFLVLNALIGVVFLRRALELIGAVRRARREGEPLPRPILHDPTDS